MLIFCIVFKRLKHLNINVAALSSNARQHYRTMLSTSLRHFHTRKLTALNPIYPEPIHERANGLQNAGDIIVEIY